MVTLGAGISPCRDQLFNIGSTIGRGGWMSAGARPEGHNLQAAMDQLHADVYRHNMAPFWAIDQSKKNDEDNQLRDKRKAVPFIWKYRSDIEPLLHRSAELINTESSERRSLILVNPGLAPKRASV